jgi:Flp pilus assembly protein TadD
VEREAQDVARARSAEGSPQADYQLALALRQTGRADAARAHFAEALRLSPWLKAPQ